jgi:hypothetical protein
VSTIEQYAFDAVTLVPREKGFDVYVAGQHRGTWRHKSEDDKYDLYLEVLGFNGAVTWSKNLGVGRTKLDSLKSKTADLLIAGELPTRRDYFDKRMMVFFGDYWKVAAVTLLAIAFGCWFL